VRALHVSVFIDGRRWQRRPRANLAETPLCAHHGRCKREGMLSASARLDARQTARQCAIRVERNPSPAGRRDGSDAPRSAGGVVRSRPPRDHVDGALRCARRGHRDCANRLGPSPLWHHDHLAPRSLAKDGQDASTGLMPSPPWVSGRPKRVRDQQTYPTLGAGWAVHSGHTGRFHTARASGSPAGPTRRSSPGGPFDSGVHLRPPISPAAPTPHRCVW
jgi:hypothetical protein